MKYQFTIAALAATVAVVYAGPIERRATLTDVDILNFALTLEHLEDAFYREGLANYTQDDFIKAGFPDPFYANLVVTSCDETTHVAFLTNALGSAAVAEATYDFPVDDPASFVALAAVLEGVGVSAYLGAAAYISDKTYLTEAGSILTVEARHSSYLRAALQENPFPQPFDDPLTFNEVYTLASKFIVSFPAGAAPLPFVAFPPLVLATNGSKIRSGDPITLLTPGYTLAAIDGVTPIYAAFITVLGAIESPVTAFSGGFITIVPEGVNGQSYVVLTACTEPDQVNDETVSAGPVIVEITN